LILTVTTWRWIFWLNVPMGILGIVLVSIFIEDIREPDVKPFDWRGFVLSSVGLCGTLFGLDALTTHNEVDFYALGALIAGLVSLTLYVFHSRQAENPILDLDLLKYPTFRISVTGGSFFRIGVGAVPFLLPLMMQQGFGYTPLQSGLVTFVSAAGSFGMRSIARKVLRRFGFRDVLIWNTFITCIFTGLCALFKPTTPYLAMIAVIFFGGVFRSLQYTALNTIGYADIDSKLMSQATSFSQMAQRLALSAGVAISAFVLHHAGSGNVNLPVHAFAAAFVTIAILSALSFVSFLKLSPNAGAELAGRVPIRSRRFDR
jgi:Na+/melibiose symporter-like transporter